MSRIHSLQHAFPILLAAAISCLVGLESSSRAAEADAPWWMTPRRMIQTNLREIDARVDLDAYVKSLADCRANVVLFNVGGIVAKGPHRAAAV